MAAGKYTWVPISLSPVDMALLDSQVKSRQAICNIYGFPSELLNDKEGSTYNNMVEKLRILYTNVTIPLLEEMAEILHPWLVAPYGDNLTWTPDWSKVPELQANIGEKVEWLSKAWWIKGTDKQKITNMEQDPDMDGYFIPAQLIREDLNIDTDEAIKQYT